MGSDELFKRRNNERIKREEARKYAKKIYHIHENDKPSASESCATVYEFFNALDKRKDELENITHF